MAVNRPNAVALRALSPLGKLGVVGLLIVLIGGVAASIGHMVEHHGKRDGEPGMTMTDVIGAYHGVSMPAPLVEALEAGHPNELAIDESLQLSDEDRQLLLDWLASDRIREDYDNLDLGDAAPAEIISFSCLDCHSRSPSHDTLGAPDVPLEYFDDVISIAFANEINPTPVEILMMSTHTHALSLAAVGVVVALLLLVSGLPRWLAGLLIGGIGVGLLADVSAWWIAREYVGFVYVIIAGGALFNGCTVLSCLLLMIDIWLPHREPASTTGQAATAE